MSVIIDSSVWIDYFNIGKPDDLDELIEQNEISTNQIILTELIPFLKVRKQIKLINLLRSISTIELNIDWSEIIHFQTKCLKAGFSGIGIPDLIIAQNAIQNNVKVYSLDKHFTKLAPIIDLDLYV